MQRIDNSGALASLPAPLNPGTPGYFGRGNPGTGLLATPLSADWANSVQEELCSFLTEAGISPSKTQYGQVLLAAKTLFVSAQSLSGQVALFAKSSAPTGWLKANGAQVSRTTYATLFAAIGTTFGVGDGSTTFNLPDMRGEFARGFDDGRGVDASRALGSAQADAFKSHVHNLKQYGGNGISSGGTNGTPPQNSNGINPTVYNFDTDATGGTETRPRNIALLFCIKF